MSGTATLERPRSRMSPNLLALEPVSTALFDHHLGAMQLHYKSAPSHIYALPLEMVYRPVIKKVDPLGTIKYVPIKQASGAAQVDALFKAQQNAVSSLVDNTKSHLTALLTKLQSDGDLQDFDSQLDQGHNDFNQNVTKVGDDLYKQARDLGHQYADQRSRILNNVNRENSFLQTLVGSVYGFLKGLYDKVAGWIKSAAEWALNAAQDVANWAAGAANDVADFFSSIF